MSECANSIGNFEATYCDVRNANVYRTRILSILSAKIKYVGL